MASEIQVEARPNIYAGMAIAVIREWGRTPPTPPHLYHYTTAEGLMGIIDSTTIRFSDAAYVNDGSEIWHAIQVLRSVTEEFVRDKRSHVHQDAFKLLNTMEKQSFQYRQVMFCLCEQNNLLNQWRDYGRDITPYCIEFDVSQLLAVGGWNFRPILIPLIYDVVEQVRLTRALAERIYGRYVQLTPEEWDTPEKQTALDQMAMAEIQWLLHQFKNGSFAAEREWRFMSVVPLMTEKPKFRASNLGVVPFYEWKRTADERLPITKVTVGPSPYSQVSDLALKQYLHERGYDIPTEFSTIPIRR